MVSSKVMIAVGWTTAGLAFFTFMSAIRFDELDNARLLINGVGAVFWTAFMFIFFGLKYMRSALTFDAIDLLSEVAVLAAALLFWIGYASSQNLTIPAFVLLLALAGANFVMRAMLGRPLRAMSRLREGASDQLSNQA